MIKSTDFISDEAKKEAEQVAIANLANAFSEEMVKRIFGEMEKFKGWDTEGAKETLHQRIGECVNAGDMVGLAAHAMFLWNLQQK